MCVFKVFIMCKFDYEVREHRRLRLKSCLQFCCFTPTVLTVYKILGVFDGMFWDCSAF
jgi:hypothetical protein